MKKLISILTFMICALPVASALADAPAEPLLSSDNRIKILFYDEADVYTITTKYGYQTNIVFERGESIQTISVGDRSLWQIIPSSNRLFIRPMQDGITTNMTVLSNRRSYQFDLKSLPTDDKSNSNIYVAKFSYSHEEPDMVRVSKPTAVPVAMVPSMPATSAPIVSDTGPGVTRPVRPNYNYTYTGSDELAPLQVYDDGQATFIRYRTPHVSFPNVYRVDALGKEEAVSYKVISDMMVVDNVMDQFRLKGDKGTITVYNEMLTQK